MVEIATARAVGDPLADEALAELRAKGSLRPDLWASVLDSDAVACRRLVDQARTVPAWLDRQGLAAGQRLFQRHALETSVVFTLDSLIQTYAVPEIAEVLVTTGRLTREVERRLAGTGKMVLDVISHGALGSAGPAVDSVMRVRLLHARVRAGLASRPHPGWPSGKVPIDQAELLLTLHAHDWVILRGLASFGVATRPDEVEGYQHLWRYVGYLMGIAPDSLPTSVEGSRRSFDHLAAALIRPTEDSRVLTTALLETASLQPPLFLPRPMIEQLSRFLLGDTVADALKLPTRPTILGALDRLVWTRARVFGASAPWLLPHRPKPRWALPRAGGLAPRLGLGYYDWMIRRSHRRAGMEFVPV